MSTGIHTLPPELILATASLLPTSALNALALASTSFHTLLQPELEARLTPELGETLLPWAIRTHKPHIVSKLLAPPHSLNPNWGAPLLLAADVQDLECTRLLLAAGADPCVDNGQEERQALHTAVQYANIPMARLLLSHGAKVDDQFGCDGAGETALHWSCQSGQIDMAGMLLDEYHASLEGSGHFGTPLAFAVRGRQVEMVRYLLGQGADASVTAPLYILLDGAPPPPLYANLVYIALGLRRPVDKRLAELMRRHRERKGVPEPVPVKWAGLPLTEETNAMLGMLLKAGASREDAMGTVRRHLTALAEAAICTEEELLEMVEGMLKAAEDTIGHS